MPHPLHSRTQKFPLGPSLHHILKRFVAFLLVFSKHEIFLCHVILTPAATPPLWVSDMIFEQPLM